MKKFLPIILILCTVLVLALNIFAGSMGGERIAVVKKVETTIDMTKIDKDAAFEEASMLSINSSTNSGSSAKIYTAWDAGAMYFYVEVIDPNLTKWVQGHASAQGKSDQAALSDYRSKVYTTLTRTDASKTLVPWNLPAFEFVIDPTNKAPDSAGKDQFSKQARITYDNWLMSYIPGDDSDKSYNEYNADRYTALAEATYVDGKVNGYKIKVKFTATALGLTGLKDWDMVSVHAFYYSTNADGLSVNTEWSDLDKVHMDKKTNWAAPYYSWYRLWDPTVSDAKNRGDAEAITETSISSSTTTTRRQISLNTTTTKKITTTSSQQNGSAGATTPAATTAAPEKKGGCKSMIGTGTIVLMTAMVTAPVILLKRKKKD